MTDMLWRWLCRLLWWAVHALWSVSEALTRRRSPKAKSGAFPHTAPRHVAVVVSEDAPPLDQLARLLVWSMAANIKNITFYDPTGLLVKNEDKLLAAAEKFKGNAPGEIKKVDTNGFSNGSSPRIIVQVLGADDGKGRILSVVRQMCDEGSPYRGFNAETLTVEHMNACIDKAYPSSLTEPSLAICFGKLCCTRGLLPWHIRLTEFLRLESDRTIRFDDFVELLHRYEKCEQRFGK